MILTPEALSSVDTFEPSLVELPEIGGDLYVAQLNADERDQLEEQWQAVRRDPDSSVGFRAYVVAFCACDESNVRYYQTGDAIQVAAEALGKRNAQAIARAFNVACEVNALLASDVEELEKN